MIDPDLEAPVSRPEPGADGDGQPAPPTERTSVVDWSRTARRLRNLLAVIGVVVVVLWVGIGLARDELTGRLLAELVGFGLLGAFVVEVAVVGGSAVRGMLAAGERGDRLARGDVSLVPPQLGRWLRGRR